MGCLRMRERSDKMRIANKEDDKQKPDIKARIIEPVPGPVPVASIIWYHTISVHVPGLVN